MRHFSTDEKKIIDYICDAEPLSSDIAVNSLITNVTICSLAWDKDKLKVYASSKEDVFKSTNQVLTLICLLDYLSQQGLIYLFHRNNVKEKKHIYNHRQGHCDIGEIPVIKDNIDSNEGTEIQLPMGKFKVGKIEGYNALYHISLPWDIADKVDEYASMVFFCSESLRNIRSNEYKDDQTIQYEENRCQAWFAIVVSIVIGLASILIPIFK